LNIMGMSWVAVVFLCFLGNQLSGIFATPQKFAPKFLPSMRPSTSLGLPTQLSIENEDDVVGDKVIKSYRLGANGKLVPTTGASVRVATLTTPTVAVAPPQPQPPVVMNLDRRRPNTLKVILAGPPAAGKGTQCANIVEKYGLIHLSTGEILRKSIADGTVLGHQVKPYMDAGQLVPDALVIELVLNRIRQDDCQTNGWLLDGFPRTKSQADALTAAGIVPDVFLMLDVPEDVLVERVTGRRTDPVTGKIYHLTFNPPPADDDAVVARLVQRSDDTAEKIRVRYREFQSHIAAVEGTYADKMVRVDGARAAAVVSDGVVDALDDVVLAKRKTDPRAVPASLEVAVVSQNAAPADAFCGASA